MLQIANRNFGFTLLHLLTSLLAPSSGRGMSAIPPLSGDKQKRRE
jgi:hypothetical protein